jgi:hypothetical protein
METESGMNGIHGERITSRVARLAALEHTFLTRGTHSAVSQPTDIPENG